MSSSTSPMDGPSSLETPRADGCCLSSAQGPVGRSSRRGVAGSPSPSPVGAPGPSSSHRPGCSRGGVEFVRGGCSPICSCEPLVTCAALFPRCRHPSKHGHAGVFSGATGKQSTTPLPSLWRSLVAIPTSLWYNRPLPSPLVWIEFGHRYLDCR
ncbi:hypothetical protein VPH35_043799 [Triticum aestivum]